MYKSLLVAAGATAAIAAIVIAAPAAHAQLIHNYLLNNSLADNLGGTALTNNGATVGASGLTFAANQGPSLTNFNNASNYSIELNFQIDNIGGYRKLIDFKNYTSDNGLYVHNAALNFFNITTSASTSLFAVNTPVQVILTRDSGTSLVVGYVNGAQAISFTDTASDAVFSITVANFLQDDHATNGEAAGGILTNLRIYDRALTASEAAGRFSGTFTGTNAAPEASSVALLGAAVLPFVGMVIARRRK